MKNAKITDDMADHFCLLVWFIFTSYFGFYLSQPF